ncbi:hypothetical protein [Flavobacterium sp. FlaQc-50]|uniref:hypothetical protein n=1 Tax=unclassified Flavobacterium TaxID=196869 RepID=UPI003758289E
MKYFIDTEFLEGPQQEVFPISLFRKQTPPTIDLISIGIVAEDRREYYAISKDFNLNEAWNRSDGAKLEKGSYIWLDGVVDNGEVVWQPDPEGFFTIEKKNYWIRENVLLPIWRELFFKADDCSGLSNKQTEQFFQDVNAGGYDHYFSFKSLKALISKYGKTNKEIAEEILKFCSDEVFVTQIDGNLVAGIDSVRGNPEFYAYYADYDWVAFCWIFGKMMDLPDGFPMYCRDLKQMLDEIQEKRFGLSIFQGNLANDIKKLPNYPNQENEHNALDDARWNKKLFEFLSKL